MPRDHNLPLFAAFLTLKEACQATQPGNVP